MPGGAMTRTTAGSTHRGARSAVDVIHGVLALVALLVLVAGIPAVLLAVGSTSYLGELTDLHRLVENLTGPDDGSLFLAVLALCAWLGWATFAIAVVLEIPAQVRGVPSLRLRGLGVQQSVAGGLVAAALAVVLLPGAANASQRPGTVALPLRPAVAASQQTVQAEDRAVKDDAIDAGPRTGGDTYLVRRGDTLWDIAEAHFGDGSRWRQIALLNYGLRQSDGGFLDRTHRLRPGWRLVLPAPPGQAPEPRGTGHTYVVRSGDTLSGIAEQELGSPDRWPDVLRASASVAQPDGEHLTDPDRIYPGWTLRIPGTASAGASAPAPVPDATNGTPTEAHDAPSARASENGVRGEPLDPSWPLDHRVAPEASRPGRAAVHPEPTPTNTRSAPDASPSVAERPDPAVDHVDDGLGEDEGDVRTVGGVGGLLAACLVVLLGARRVRQQRRRRPGERVPLPPASVLATEARLRSVADVAGVGHVDLALRALAADHRARAVPLPGLRSARLTRRHLELYLTEPAVLPQPWCATSDPTVWVIGHEELTGQPEIDIRAPYPALVTIGHDLEDAHVLLDLEQAVALAIDGDRSDTLAVLAAVAVELATSPWADDLLVTLVGCLPELPDTVTTGRLRHVDRLEQLIADLEGRAADVERVLLDAGAADLAAARGTGVADDAWAPEIVLLADDVPEPLRGRLDTVLHRVPRVGVAAVTAAGAALGDWRLQLDTSTALARLEPVGVTLRPQRLAGAEYDDVLRLLQTSDADATAGPAWAADLPSLEQALADLPAPSPVDDSPVDDSPVDDSPVDDLPVGVSPGDVSPVEALPVPALPEDVDHQARSGPAEATSTAAGDDGEIVPLPRRAPHVRLFGRVEVVGALGPEPVTIKDGRAVANHVGRATALVAYLACRPEGATTEQLSEALSPVRRLTPSTVWSLASRTRKWLGSDPDGLPYFPRTADAGAHRLHPALRTDWADWLELVGDDVMASPMSRLVQALAMVRGRPFDGVTERHYVWAEPLRQEMIAGIVDVSHEVVRRALLVPDAAAARKAVAVGRLVDPTNELLWRDALRVEYVVGTRESRKRLVEQLYGLADDLETDLEPETEQLITEFERAGSERAGSRRAAAR